MVMASWHSDCFYARLRFSLQASCAFQIAESNPSKSALSWRLRRTIILSPIHFMAKPNLTSSARNKLLLISAIVGLAIAIFIGMRWKSAQSLLTRSTSSAATGASQVDQSAPLLPQWEVGADGVAALRLPETVIRSMQLTSEPAVASTSDSSLRLTGQLMLDPSRLVHVNTRFDGEVMRIEDSTPHESNKSGTLRVGDRVKKVNYWLSFGAKRSARRRATLSTHSRN